MSQKYLVEIVRNESKKNGSIIKGCISQFSGVLIGQTEINLTIYLDNDINRLNIRGINEYTDINKQIHK